MPPLREHLSATVDSQLRGSPTLSTQIVVFLSKVARIHGFWQGLGNYFDGAFDEGRFFFGVGQLVEAGRQAL